MKEQDFLRLMGQIDDKYIDEMSDTYTMEAPALSSHAERGSINTMDPTRKCKRLGRTLLLAAVLATLFSAAAFAIGYTIHQRRQEELRRSLQIDENNVAGYMEYETANYSIDGPRVTLLSAIRDGEFQYIYVNVSPVTEEDVQIAVRKGRFVFSYDGGDSWAVAGPAFDISDTAKQHLISYYDEATQQEIQFVDPDHVAAQALSQAYDADTQTVTLKLHILSSVLDTMTTDSVEIMIKAVDVLQNAAGESEMIDVTSFGSFLFAPTESECRRLSFGEGVTAVDPANGGVMRILGATVYPTGMTWEYEHDDADRCYDPNSPRFSRETQLQWVDLCNDALRAKLNFSDGTSVAVYGGESPQYNDGLVFSSCSWAGTIDINAIQSITLLGETIPVE